jgi:hypothetical protein
MLISNHERSAFYHQTSNINFLGGLCAQNLLERRNNARGEQMSGRPRNEKLLCAKTLTWECRPPTVQPQEDIYNCNAGAVLDLLRQGILGLVTNEPHYHVHCDCASATVISFTLLPQKLVAEDPSG